MISTYVSNLFNHYIRRISILINSFITKHSEDFNIQDTYDVISYHELKTARNKLVQSFRHELSTIDYIISLLTNKKSPSEEIQKYLFHQLSIFVKNIETYATKYEHTWILLTNNEMKQCNESLQDILDEREKQKEQNNKKQTEEKKQPEKKTEQNKSELTIKPILKPSSSLEIDRAKRLREQIELCEMDDDDDNILSTKRQRTAVTVEDVEESSELSEISDSEAESQTY
jgi:hypothetical protein